MYKSSFSRRFITHTFKQFNGGFVTYWKLIPMIYAQVINQAKDHPLFWFLLPLLILKTPYWALLKPLGAFLFWRYKKYEVVVEDNTLITKYSRVMFVMLFGFLPIPCGVSHAPNKADLDTLFKEDAPRMLTKVPLDA